MNQDLMIDYIDYVADNIYNDLGINVSIRKCPFEFMKKISIPKKQNFFEKRVSEYQKADLNNMNLNEDF
jgi:ribonucleotide reductase beta subunit family protein with ferritin-like domain